MFIVIQSINTIRNELKSRNQSVSNNNNCNLLHQRYREFYISTIYPEMDITKITLQYKTLN